MPDPITESDIKQAIISAIAYDNTAEALANAIAEMLRARGVDVKKETTHAHETKAQAHDEAR
jgi:flavorubredoxin